MRRMGMGVAAILLLLMMALPVQAQLAIELQLNRTVYMQFEPMFAKVSIRNYSGQPLVFGKDDKLRGELCFDVAMGNIGLPGTTVPGKVYPLEGTIFLPGETKDFLIPLSNYHNFRKLGAYRVHAYVKHAMLKDMFRSNECRAEINPGVVIWSREVGIPELLRATEKISDKIKTRTYSLRMMVENSNKYYYLVIEDRDTIYAVLRVGQEIGMERYKVEVDMLSRLHLLMPLSPRVFRYFVVNLNGKAEVNKFLKTTKTIPSLVRDPVSGQVIQTGGADAVPGIDYVNPTKGEKPNVTGNPMGTIR